MALKAGEGASRLAGVRLGKRERHVLRLASAPESLGGWPIDGGRERAFQEALGRAARKLERVGLIETERIAIEGRAKDPRRERFLYRDACFWALVEKTRRQVTYRKRAWRTQFGEAIHHAYRLELALGLPVRWDERAIRAERAAERRPAGRLLREHRRLREGAGTEIRKPPFQSEIGSLEVYPEPSYPNEARSPEERWRWDVCARLVGVNKVPPIDPNAMWHEAIAIYHSAVPTEELARLWRSALHAAAAK